MSSRLLALMLLGLVACGGFERGDPSPDDMSGGDGDTSGDDDGGSSFASSVLPILMARCGSCHGSGGLAAGSAYHLSGDAATDHDTVLALVNVASPATSTLLREATGESHGGGAVIATSSDDYSTILAWITEGASP
ncbi:MAG: hypothetical protein ACAI38_17275 [Myxococcota bacterium]|nr:hypothetical protein [Myxococcota bacterium]